MSDLDHILTQISKEHLGISTLQARNNDSLDFYDVAVWQVTSMIRTRFAICCGICFVPTYANKVANERV